MVYMTSLPGGWIADRLIGQRRAVLYGGILIACGHFSMAFPSSTTFYLGLALIVLGTGLLKGNVSVIVGQLYAPEDHAARRRLLDLLHGDQPRRVHRAAGLRLPRPARQLAHRLRRAGHRHGARPRAVRARARKYLGDAGLAPDARRRRPPRPRSCRRRALIWAAPQLPLVVLFAVGLYTGALPITPTQIADAAGVLAPRHDGRLFRLAVSRRRLDPVERRRLYVIWRSSSRRACSGRCSSRPARR